MRLLTKKQFSMNSPKLHNLRRTNKNWKRVLWGTLDSAYLQVWMSRTKFCLVVREDHHEYYNNTYKAKF